MKTIRELRKEGLNILIRNNIEDATSTVDSILSLVFGMNKQELISYDDRKVIKYKEEKFLEAINKRIKDVPLSYITGSREFMKDKYKVNENVLIPRQDTEVLVESAIVVLKKMASENDEDIELLDMCTGSGCIAISILLYLRKNNYKDIYNRLHITAVDVSQEAIDVAKENAENHNVIDKIEFVQSNLFEKIPYKIFDIVLSNPPYIKTGVIKTLDKTVQNEPLIALDGGEDGLDFYRDISKKARENLNDDGYIIFEIGYDQAQDVCDILKENDYTTTVIKKDLSNNDRVIISKK